VAFLTACTSEKRVLSSLPSPYLLDTQEQGPATIPAAIVPESAPAAAPIEPEPQLVQAQQPTQPAMHVPQEWMPTGAISSRWECIVLHHSDGEAGSLADINRWHLSRGWEHGCGYHFVIGNGSRSADGHVEVSHRWRQQLHGAHTRLAESFAQQKHVDFEYYNDHGIGIALVGNFQKTGPSEHQLDQLAELVHFLMRTCDIPLSRIYTHGQVDQTLCPGQHFNMDDLRLRLWALEHSSSLGEAVPRHGDDLPQDGAQPPADWNR